MCGYPVPGERAGCQRRAGWQTGWFPAWTAPTTDAATDAATDATTGATTAAGSPGTAASTAGPAPRRSRPDERVGDHERERAADLLGDAAAAGYLGVAELDDRLSAALGARTRGELDAAVADVPAHLARQRERRQAAERARSLARAGLRPHLASYLAVMALLVGIWLAVGVTAGAWYPWPIWPALGWGIGVASHARAAMARPA